VLIVLADGAAAKWAAAVFMATSVLLFGNSALYHRFTWGPTTKAVLKRIDHANIMLLIAGTYTPIAVLALPPDKGALLLVLVWSGAMLGILFRVFWINAPRWLYVALYLLLGWAAVMYLGDLLQANVAMMILVIVGGLLYTGGAVCYALKKPNRGRATSASTRSSTCAPVLAFLCHWTACLLIALHPRTCSLDRPAEREEDARSAVVCARRIDVLVDGLLSTAAIAWPDAPRHRPASSASLHVPSAVAGATDAPQHVDDEEHTTTATSAIATNPRTRA
jgi:hemolysin III